MKRTVLALAALAVSCVAQGGEAEIDPPRCASSEECAEVWHAVTRWVSNNTDMSVQVFTPRRLSATIRRYGCYLDLKAKLGTEQLETKVMPSVRYSRPNGPTRESGCSTAPAKLKDQFHQEIKSYLATQVGRP